MDSGSDSDTSSSGVAAPVGAAPILMKMHSRWGNSGRVLVGKDKKGANSFFLKPDCPGQSGTSPEQYRTVQDCLGPSVTVRDCPGLSGTVRDTRFVLIRHCIWSLIMPLY